MWFGNGEQQLCGCNKRHCVPFHHEVSACGDVQQTGNAALHAPNGMNHVIDLA